jgi:hypothetical protein
MAKQIIDPERINELREALSKLDPAGRKAWTLEVFELKNGAEVLKTVVDLKTGRPVKRRRDPEEMSQNVT